MQFLGGKEVFDESWIYKYECDLVTSVGENNIIIEPGMFFVIKRISVLSLMIFLVLN